MYMMCGWAQCTMATFMLHFLYVLWYSFDFRVVIYSICRCLFRSFCVWCAQLKSKQQWTTWRHCPFVRERAYKFTEISIRWINGYMYIYRKILALVHLHVSIWKLLKQLEIGNKFVLKCSKVLFQRNEEARKRNQFRFVTCIMQNADDTIWFRLFCILHLLFSTVSHLSFPHSMLAICQIVVEAVSLDFDLEFYSTVR